MALLPGYYALTPEAKKVYDANAGNTNYQQQIINEAMSAYAQRNIYNKDAPKWEDYVRTLEPGYVAPTPLTLDTGAVVSPNDPNYAQLALEQQNAQAQKASDDALAANPIPVSPTITPTIATTPISSVASSQTNVATSPINAVTYYKNGSPIDPTKYTNLTPGSLDFENYLKEQGITKQISTTQTNIGGAVYLPNEKALQEARVELGNMGIPTSEWSRYISSPDANGRIYYTKPTLPKSSGYDVQISVPEQKSADASITADVMGSEETPIQLPYANISSDPAADILGGAEISIKLLQERLDSLDTSLAKQTEEKITDFETKLSGLLDETADNATDQLSFEEQFKVPQLRADYKAALAEYDARKAQWEITRQAIEDKPITMSSIMGQQAQAEKKALADLGFWQARANGLLGQVEEAQRQADRAVDLKYFTIETRINIYQAQLQILEGTLTREEEKVALQKQLMLDEYKQNIADQKDNEKNILNIALSAQANGAGGALVNSIINSGSILEASQKAGELLNSGGWTYVSTIAQRDSLIAQGYEITQAGGRTYARKPAMTSLQEYEAKKQIDAKYRVGSGGGGGENNYAFNFSNDDKGRLLAAGFSQTEVDQVESDLNNYGLVAVIEGMDNDKAKVVSDIAKGVTPTQANKPEEEQFLTEDYFKTIFTEKQLKASAKEAGFRSIMTSWEEEKTKYLKYLMDLVGQYRIAGYSDKEIFKMMQ